MQRPLAALPLPDDLKPTQASPSLQRFDPKLQIPSLPSACSNHPFGLAVFTPLRLHHSAILASSIEAMPWTYASSACQAPAIAGQHAKPEHCRYSENLTLRGGCAQGCACSQEVPQEALHILY